VWHIRSNRKKKEGSRKTNKQRKKRIKLEGGQKNGREIKESGQT